MQVIYTMYFYSFNASNHFQSHYSSIDNTYMPCLPFIVISCFLFYFWFFFILVLDFFSPFVNVTISDCLKDINQNPSKEFALTSLQDPTCCHKRMLNFKKVIHNTTYKMGVESVTKNSIKNMSWLTYTLLRLLHFIEILQGQVWWKVEENCTIRDIFDLYTEFSCCLFHGLFECSHHSLRISHQNKC